MGTYSRTALGILHLLASAILVHYDKGLKPGLWQAFPWSFCPGYACVT